MPVTQTVGRLSLRMENEMIVDSLDERLLNCCFCGKKFFDTPDAALFGWDDDTPIYACVPCDAAQQSVHLTAAGGESAGDGNNSGGK